jgi:hypothetical protein
MTGKRSVLAAAALTAGLLGTALMPTRASAQSLSADEARAIAKEAYIYGFPPVDSYRILYSYFVDESSPEYKGPWNEIHHNARVFTPADTAMQTPNSDTPYSQLALDLRTEPMVLSVPEVEEGRYYTVEVNDLYTFITDYVGSRTTGNEAGSFLIVGPDWQGETPPGIEKVIRSETELSFLFFRTQLFRPEDIENVKKVQAGFKVQPLSSFLGEPAPLPAPPIAFLKPLGAEEERTSLDFFRVLNWVLQFGPIHPSETEMMARFAKLDIGPGKTFDPEKFTPEIRKAIEEGIADAWKDLDALGERIARGEVTSGDVLGSREHLKGNYLYRMRGTVAGIWGNTAEEAIYLAYYNDSSVQPLDGSNRYRLRFAPDQLPPVNAFWSLTLYNLPARLLVDNPIDRYLINSPMLPDLKRDADGGLTLYIQKAPPGADQESNWLPAPDGPFMLALRLYWPKPEALSGIWKQPPLERVS